MHTHGVRISVHAFLSKGIELFVERMSTLPLALLELNLILISISILPLSVPGLIKLDVGCFAIELDILGKILGQGC